MSHDNIDRQSKMEGGFAPPFAYCSCFYSGIQVEAVLEEDVLTTSPVLT